VYRGIEQKAERHRQGRSTRPLRLEFCEADVRALFDDWRRAVGVTVAVDAATDAASPAIDERRRPSLTRQLERAIDRLVRAAGRLDAADAVRVALTGLIDNLVAARDDCRHARGDARRLVIDRLTAIDREIAVVARLALGDALAGVVAEAESELAPYRGRLAPEAWQRSLDASIDRLSRDRVGMPTLDLDPMPS
jgi:Arc/MetJ-type ribon-helix-helix transcriptional regulator